MMSETNKADARGATPDRLMSRALLTFYVLAPTRVAISRLAAHSRIAVLWLAAAVLALGTLWGACSSMRVSQAWIFYASAIAAIGSFTAVLLIREGDIDHAAARVDDLEGMRGARGGETPANWRALARDRRLLAFAALVVIFHFANAAMLPLVGELLWQGRPHQSSPYMSACIIIAQTVMVPIAVTIGRIADVRGRKLPFQIGFAVLALAGFLYTARRNPYYLMAVQSLDGLGAAIFGVL
jgi:hypothetical protein